MATKRHEDEGQNPFSMVFAGVFERHHFQNFIFVDNMYSSTSFLQFRGQKLEQVFVDIVLSPNMFRMLPKPRKEALAGSVTSRMLPKPSQEAPA